MAEINVNTKLLHRKIETRFEILKLEFCYMESKNIAHPDRKPMDCPWGYTEFIKEKCRHCRWYGEKTIEETEK